MESHSIILFLCPHNAAKSVIAAAYCERLASRRGLKVLAASAGTAPDPQVPPAVVVALRAEGIDVSGHRPRRVTRDELAAARRVVTLGCDLGDLPPPQVRVERWDDVPPPSHDLAGACQAIRDHIVRLLDDLAAAAGPGDVAPAGALPPARPGGIP